MHSNIMLLKIIKLVHEMPNAQPHKGAFPIFLSGGFTSMAIINTTDLTKRTSVNRSKPVQISDYVYKNSPLQDFSYKDFSKR